jgi:peptidoglycan/LPS O-acetylase OafA/YrhL
LKYRADINGLRAVAVLAVVANHVGIELFHGGFLGVDVFFVISGYLISGIIFSEVKAGNFSVRKFYERRVRRIFPALAAVFAAALILAYIYCLPFEIKKFSQSLLAATFCVSNLYFWGQSGYFEALATEKPLLHTWSLAVEEQFYFFFPVFVLLSYKILRQKLGMFILVLFFASLAVGVLGAYYRPVAAFYLAPLRAWELLMGAVLAADILPEIRTAVGRNTAGLVGIALIAVSIVIFSADTLYPGIASVVPCLGAALIIYAGRKGGSWVGALLSSAPMVFIGLISYSLYLWHWPIIVFHRMGLFPSTGRWPGLEIAAIIGVSIFVSWLSWKYIETPFRDKTVSTTVLYRFALASVVGLVAASAVLLTSNGLPSRFPPNVAQVASFLDYDQGSVSREGSCFLTPKFSRLDVEATCLQGDAAKKNYLLIGDSHAAHLWFGLEKVFPDVNVLQATSAGCKPSLDPARHEDKRRCRKLMDYIYFDYLPAHKVDALLIEAIWRKEDLPLLPRTLDYAKLHANTVVLFGPMVQYDAGLPRLMAVSLLNHDPGYPERHRLDFLEDLDRQMAALAREKNVVYVSFFDMLCPGGQCETQNPNGVPMLYDYGHLTTDGSARVAAYLRDHSQLP